MVEQRFYLMIIPFFAQIRNLLADGSLSFGILTPAVRSGPFLLKRASFLDVGFYRGVQSFEQNFLADFCFGFVAAFAQFAFWAGAVHRIEPVLVVDVFVRHTKIWLRL